MADLLLFFGTGWNLLLYCWIQSQFFNNCPELNMALKVEALTTIMMSAELSCTHENDFIYVSSC